MKYDNEQEKVVHIDKRIPKIKEQRKQKTNRRLITFILLFFLMVLLIVYFQTPISKVSTIEISGNKNVPTKTIETESGIQNGSTEFWSLNQAETEKNIETNKLIKTVEVSKILPNKIQIRIEEYKSIAYLEKEEQYFPVLENGTVLPEGGLPKEGMPILMDWTDNEKRKQLAEQLIKLPESINRSISEIYYTPSESDPSHMTLYMNDGFIVSASLKTFSNKMNSYPDIVKEIDDGAKGIIHMEVATYFEEFPPKKEETKEKGR
ncbi:cell division protein FtsQ/DivIB [Bacillus gobiensis]|uniref:cell division protein FtsQ/DivIB n=1 Tax=Bacillus gobiensis TaxID=1441095 RepID=UPI003D1F2017